MNFFLLQNDPDIKKNDSPVKWKADFKIKFIQYSRPICMGFTRRAA